DALRRLERMRLIKLPPKLADVHNTRPATRDRRRVRLPPGTVKPVVVMPESLTFELAKSNATENLWNAIVEKHHYLGHNIQVGRCLKYLIRGDGQLLGAISFSSPAWRLAPR